MNLIAVYDSTALEAQLQLNPGPDYIMKSYDYCFYMSLTKEENVKFSPKTLAEEKKSAPTSIMSESREKNIGEHDQQLLRFFYFLLCFKNYFFNLFSLVYFRSQKSQYFPE